MTAGGEPGAAPDLCDLSECFEGAVPAVVATAAADGTPNVTYLSRVRMVDDERIALSNQFFSKTSRNLAENPRASVLLVDPTTYDQFRLTLVYERTERRGPLFEQLRGDVDAVAALSGMQDVFKLRAADVYRVQHIDRIPVLSSPPRFVRGVSRRSPGEMPVQLGELSARLSRCPDLDTLLGTALDGLADLLGYEHSLLLLLDETGKRLYTIASRGYETQGVGSEVVVGEGVIGMVAARGAAIRLGNLRQMGKYSRAVRRTFEEHGHVGPGHEIPVPGLPDADSRVAVPAMVLGQLVGVLVVESEDAVAFDQADEALLTVVAGIVASAVEIDLAQERAATGEQTSRVAAPGAPGVSQDQRLVRFFPVDGSVFVDNDYLIKGVAGRILWSLLQQHAREGRDEFTNKEVRLDPTLELPEFRDNLDSRLILLKRRLEERAAPVRIEKTGRGRFRLFVTEPLRLEASG
ncbi:MAG: GAF domain-containing protein [Actinobacteria bacterium]|nr:GAF domain-containing protein [Actinomycetota bacterium]